MSASIENQGRGGVLTIEVKGVAETTAGAIGEVDNPEGVNLLITRATWHVVAPSTGAANLSCGVDTSAGTFNDIINALAVNGGITGKVYNGHAMQNTAKTEIAAPAIWTAAKQLGFTGSASTVGLEGRLYVEYIRVG